MQDPQTNPLDKLTPKQKVFVLAYCQHRNGARAAREAGYSGPGSRQEAHRLLTNADISGVISLLMDQYAMSASECLARMTAFARGTIDHFMTEEGELTLTSEDAIENRGLLKKVRQRKIVRTTLGGDKLEETITEVELYDAKDAVDVMMQVHGLKNTKVDLSSLSDEQIDALLNKAINKLG